MTMTVSTRTLTEQLLALIGAGDAEGVAALHADHVDWKVNWPAAEFGRSETPWIRSRSTRADIADLYRELGEYHVVGGLGTEIERILVDGDDAVIMGEFRQTAGATGRAYSSRFVMHVTFEDGLVIRNHMYEDSLAVAQAFAE
ncbi:nuclear transport factor 2 family protein [Nocardioidaceae bacterium SCSIO 66511]|nr:nuclear transport factor 2 family protein [Nocardioidaceae bacterium SCSIO 66511]